MHVEVENTTNNKNILREVVLNNIKCQKMENNCIEYYFYTYQ